MVVHHALNGVCASSGMNPTRALIVTFAVLWIGGCGSGSRSGRTSGSHYILTAEEIATVNVNNAYDAVYQLRPYFFQKKGTASPVVYRDNVRYGDPLSLREIPAASVHQIEYINPSDATTRFGRGHLGGVIMVLTKSQ